MAFTKIWTGATDGDYNDQANWDKVPVVSADWSWTASGSGTNEYYLRTAASGDPGFAAQPDKVHINGAEATEGTVGSLTAGQWDYGDNDTLGYSTLYVRLSDGTDPDTKTNGYVEFGQIPTAGDDVKIQGAVSIDEGLGQRLVELNSFRVVGYTGTIGSRQDFLFIDLGASDELRFEGSGAAYIDIGSADISPIVEAAASTTELHLRGSAIVNIDLRRGRLHLESATVTGDIRQGFISSQNSDSALIVDSACTLTGVDLLKSGGSAVINVALGTIANNAGTCETRGNGAVTTWTNNGGNSYPNSSGTITTYNADGGATDFTRSAQARTVTTLNRRGSATVSYDPDVLTVTNAIGGAGAMQLSAA